MKSKHTSITIAAVQPHLRANDNTPISSAHHVINLMKQTSEKRHVDLFVLPELCPLGYSEDTFDNYLPKNLDNINVIREIDDLMRHFAKVRLYVCFVSLYCDGVFW